MSKFAELKIETKLFLLALVFLMGFALFGLFSFSSLNRVKVNGPIYAHIEQNHQVIEDILPPPMYIIESYLNSLQMLHSAELGARGEVLALCAKATQLRHDYEERYGYWMRELPDGELKETLARSHVPAMEFYTTRDQDFIPAVLTGDLQTAGTIDRTVLRPNYEAHRQQIERAVLVATERATMDERQASEMIATNHLWLLVIGFGTAGLVLLFCICISRSIAAPLAKIAAMARTFPEGAVDTAALSRFSPRNEVGALAHAFAAMTTQLSVYIDKLRSSEMKYRIVADNTYDWEFWRNAAGDYIYSSPSCERVTGYTPADFTADQDLILRLLHPDDIAQWHEHQDLTLRPDCPPLSQIEYRIIAADGTVRWINHVCCPVFDEAGNFLGKRGTNRDISAQKKAEAALTEAKEQAEEASRAKSAFIASMSHELRTPLNAIMGYTQILLRDEKLSGLQRNHLEIVRGSGSHLLSLINEILDMGKIEGGKMEVHETAFDLGALLRQVLDLSRKSAEEKGLQFIYQAIGAMPTYVRGDPWKLQQILLSLLDNAIRYTREGGVTLRVRYEGGSFNCEVADTGIGIAADKLEAIFEPFTQLGREGQVTEGTGVGLTIARHLVTLMGGSIEVESRPGEGSTFRFHTPLPASSIAEAPLVALLPQVAAETTGDQRRFREEDVPPPEKLRELDELVMLGDMRKIRIWGEDLIQSDKRFRSFGEEVRDLAAGFKAKALAALVEQCLRKKEV